MPTTSRSEAPSVGRRRTFAGLLPSDVELHADRVRCPGCRGWAPRLFRTPERRLRCENCSGVPERRTVLIPLGMGRLGGVQVPSRPSSREAP